MQGAILQMINHGLSTGALFLLVGMLYDRAHTKAIAEFGGVATIMPVYASAFMIVSLSSLGLPGLNGFVGEFLILIGSFKSEVLGTPVYAILAAVGVILAAVYLLWMYNRVFFGPPKADGVYHNNKLTDIDTKELASLGLIIIFIVWIGVYPSTFLGKSAGFSKSIVEKVENVSRGNVPTKMMGSR
jgi:NADH-quinone oxidoreductase subunit M